MGSIYKCDKCKDSGIIITTDESGYEFGTTCECRIREYAKRRLERSGLSKLADKYTFKDYKVQYKFQEVAKGMAEEYAKEPKGWFYIGGQVGAGKTHLCTAISTAIIESGNNLRYMLWRDTSMHLNSLPFEEREMAETKYKDTPYLYIDDLFKGNSSEAEKMLAFRIINWRYNKEFPTIISTEYRTDELMNFEEAIASRIIERCGRNVINISKNRNKNVRL